MNNPIRLFKQVIAGIYTTGAIGSFSYLRSQPSSDSFLKLRSLAVDDLTAELIDYSMVVDEIGQSFIWPYYAASLFDDLIRLRAYEMTEGVFDDYRKAKLIR